MRRLATFVDRALATCAIAVFVTCGHPAADSTPLTSVRWFAPSRAPSRAPRKTAAPSPAVVADAAPAPTRPLVPADAGLVIGEFRMAKVTDGDTIRVEGLDASLRLLGFDAEETFKSKADRRAFDGGWEAYKVAKRGSSPRPVKFATPLGEDAKHFATEFFEGVEQVRLERDDPAEIRDRYDRYLAYVFAKKHGQWVNYNVEAVRAGMAPYFPKYGRSRRFHSDFVDAEAEAKAQRRGIWAPGAQSYPDYAEREAWWTARGDFMEDFRKEAIGKPSYIDITHADAMSRLEALVGKDVVMIGVIDQIWADEHRPTRVVLSGPQKSDFPLIFFDKRVLAASGVERWRGELVIVSGVPSIYENKRTHAHQLQIVVDHASQIRLSPVPGLELPTVAP